MMRRGQLGMVVLVVTVAGLLIAGAGSAFAQQGNETTAPGNSSKFTCEETTELVIAVGEDGNITESVPVGYVTYSDRVDQVERAIQQEYMDQAGVEDVYIERDPNKTVCGQNVSRVGVGINFSVFEGSIPEQRNGVNIATHEARGEVVLMGGGATAVNGTAGNETTGNDTVVVGENVTGGDAQIISVNETAEEGADSGEGNAKSGDTGTEDSGDAGGKAKTGEDGTGDGGTGKAKMSDGGDGDDTENGGNGKAKDGGGEETDDDDGADRGGKDKIGDETETSGEAPGTDTDTETEPETDTVTDTETAGEGPATDTDTDTTTTTADTETTTTTTTQVEALTNGFSVVGVVAVLGILSVALLFRREE